MPTTPSSNNHTVVRPADRDYFHWWMAADDLITAIDQAQITRDWEKEALRNAQAQKRHCKEACRPIETMHASSGPRVSAEHWILDWALVKARPAVYIGDVAESKSFLPIPCVFPLSRNLVVLELSGMELCIKFTRGKPLSFARDTVIGLLAAETRVPLCFTAMEKLWVSSSLYPETRWRGALQRKSLDFREILDEGFTCRQ